MSELGTSVAGRGGRAHGRLCHGAAPMPGRASPFRGVLTSQARGPPPLPRRRLTDDGRRHPRPSEAGRPGIGRPASGRLMKECHDRCRFPRFPSFLHAAGGVGLRLPSVCGPTAIVPANHKPRLARLAATGGRRRGGRRGGAAEREVDSPCSVSPSTSSPCHAPRTPNRAKDAARTDD